MENISIKEEAEDDDDEDDDYMAFIPEIILKKEVDHSVLVKEALVKNESENEEDDKCDPFSVDADKIVTKKIKAESKARKSKNTTKTKKSDSSKNSERYKDQGDSEFDSDDDIALSNVKKQKLDIQKSETDDCKPSFIIKQEETNVEDQVKSEEPDSEEKKPIRRITKELKYICMDKKCENVPVFESPFAFMDHFDLIHKKTLSVAKIKASISIRKDAKPIVQINPKKIADFVVCTKCNHEFSTMPGLKKHTEKGKCKEVKSNFVCNFCNKDMKRMDLRILHIKLEHPEEGGEFLNCQMCNEQFKTKLEIADHYTTVHDNRFECQYCTKAFAQAKLLIHHTRQQHRLVGFKCDECGKCCRSVKELQDHKQVHNVEANVKCPDCEITFTSTVKMNYHYKRIHDTGEYTCQICSQTFVTRHRLNTHNYFKHKEKNFQCHICAKKFLTNRELVIHCLWHEGLYTYKTKSKKKPRVGRTDRTYSCRVCEMKTTERSIIQEHMKTAHTERKRYRRGTKEHFCDICKKKFPEKRYLTYHMKRQSVHMKHECDICQEVILGIVNFRNHKKSHSKDAFN